MNTPSGMYMRTVNGEEDITFKYIKCIVKGFSKVYQKQIDHRDTN